MRIITATFTSGLAIFRRTEGKASMLKAGYLTVNRIIKYALSRNNKLRMATENYLESHPAIKDVCMRQLAERLISGKLNLSDILEASPSFIGQAFQYIPNDQAIKVAQNARSRIRVYVSKEEARGNKKCLGPQPERGEIAYTQEVITISTESKFISWGYVYRFLNEIWQSFEDPNTHVWQRIAKTMMDYLPKDREISEKKKRVIHVETTLEVD